MDPLVVFLACENGALFLLVGWDKWRAIRGGRRVPEAWFFLSSAVGAFVGTWLGCYAFRHKTRKRSFQVKLAVATAVNAVWAWAAWKGLGG